MLSIDISILLLSAGRKRTAQQGPLPLVPRGRSNRSLSPPSIQLQASNHRFALKFLFTGKCCNWESCEDDIEGAHERDVETRLGGFPRCGRFRQKTKGKSCN